MLLLLLLLLCFVTRDVGVEDAEDAAEFPLMRLSVPTLQLSSTTSTTSTWVSFSVVFAFPRAEEKSSSDEDEDVDEAEGDRRDLGSTRFIAFEDPVDAFDDPFDDILGSVRGWVVTARRPSGNCHPVLTHPLGGWAREPQLPRPISAALVKRSFSSKRR